MFSGVNDNEGAIQQLKGDFNVLYLEENTQICLFYEEERLLSKPYLNKVKW